MAVFKFPASVLKKIKKYLLFKKEQTEKKLEDLKKEDPFNDPDRLIDNAAIDTEVKEQVGHERIEAIKRELERTLAAVKKALAKIGIGKYGFCENCGKLIDTERLAIYPLADRCTECEKKLSGEAKKSSKERKKDLF